MGNPSKIKCAFITTDSRGPFGEWNEALPILGTAPAALLQGFAACDDVEVHVISCSQQKLHSTEKLAENVFFHNLHVSKTGWMRTLYQGCVRAVRRKLKEIQPDIVHGQGTERDCSLDAIFSGYPNVLTIHGNMRLIAKVNRATLFSYQWLAARLEAFAVPRADGIVCITNYTRDAVSDLAKKTWVAPNAVDLKFFNVDAAPGQNECPVIVYIGDICLRKNQNAFIRALDELAAERKFKVIFFGTARRGQSYDEEFLQLVAQRAWCKFEGAKSHDVIIAHLKGASLLALASLEDNCPMVVLEAMAAGVPVVAANVGGVPDLVEDGKTGLLCNPLDAASMKNAVKKILAQTEMAQAMASEAKKRARERFHPAVIARRHLEIYREVLNSRS